jgi:SWI/SNF related-matrix-associated actin-dependent regulator of chromatin subfamily C
MSGGSKKKSGSKKGGSAKGGDTNGGNGNGNESNNESSNPLIRPVDNHTINPRGILTGFYQKNGKRVQHTVHDGALQMTKDAVDVIETATAKLTAGMVQSIPKYDLPGLDSVVRPCLDPKLETITVTELVMEKVQIPQEQPAAIGAAMSQSATGLPGAAVFPPVVPTVVKMIKTSRPTAKIRRIRRLPIKKQSGTAAERIRGGGDVPTIEGQPPAQKQEPEAVVKMDIDQTESAAAVTPLVSLQPTGASGGQTVHNTITVATGDVAMAPTPPTQQDPQKASLETTHEAKISGTDIIVATEIATIPTAAKANIDNLNNIPVPSGGENTGDKNAGSSTTIHPPTAAVTTSADFLMPPKNVTSDSKETSGEALSVPTATTPPTSSVGLVAKESGGEMKPATSSNDDKTLQQQQAPTVAMAEAPAKTLPSDQPAPDKGSSTQIERKDTPAEKRPALDGSQSRSAPTVQASVAPPSSSTVVTTREADPKPTTTVASDAVVSTGLVSSSIVAAAVAGTKNSSAENVAASSVVTNASSAEASGVEKTAAQRMAVVPVVTSSTPRAGARPASSIQVKEETKKSIEEVPEAKALQSKPAPQWEQHKPGPNDETITPENQLPPMPEWYKKDGINEIEKTMLPEWFDASSSHRTPQAYIKSREKVIEMSEALSNRNVTNAMIRRSVVGDAGSLQRLRNFLVNWGIINRDGINDSAPTTASLRPNLKRSAEFTDDMRDSLILAVTEQAAKKRKMLASSSSASVTPLSLDWDEVAYRVGHGVSAENCRESFMTARLSGEPSDAMSVSEDASSSADESLPTGAKSNHSFAQNLLDSSNPEVLQKMFDAAVEATEFNSVKTRAASLLGLRVTQALENARGHELDLALRLSKLLDARMKKLENRMAMLDDVEGILEAEKVALEMERRDLYTARCRHWFGGV